MTLTRTRLIVLAGAGSVAILAGALGFQYLGGIDPCELCLWQRWPHALAILTALAALALGGRMMPFAGTLLMLGSVGLGLFHTGVERHWWPGPASCTGDIGSMANLTAEQLLNPALVKPVVLCDVVVWQFLGLSMASYNALASLALAVLWGWSFARSRA